jgi:hypothetical protein
MTTYLSFHVLELAIRTRDDQLRRKATLTRQAGPGAGRFYQSCGCLDVPSMAPTRRSRPLGSPREKDLR